MKIKQRKVVLGGMLAVAAGVVIWQYRAYVTERDAIDERIRAYTFDIQARDRQMEERARLTRELRSFAASTFGTEEEKVTASFRKSLNEIIAHFGLIEATVTSARPVGVKNPAMDARVSEFARLMSKDQRAIASSADFYAVSGTLSSKGTLEQALRVMSTLQVQPWIHRIDGFSIKPVGKEGNRVEMSVTLTTTYFMDPKLRDNAEDPGWRPVREAEFASWMPIVVKNMFREPPPPAPAVAVVATAAPATAAQTPTIAPATPPPPYDEWRISGMARGKDGPTLMLVNEKTREWRTIDVGGTILDAKFVTGEGEVAQIIIGEERYTVRTGQRLSERARVQ